ncbi:glycosyltransferase [Polynucleobacter sp. UK-Mo-2m-Kol15]|uniref:MraY family glycosyltransferase n=1 Tax=Polynucleobacter sp. UK-Mo-2m-Kol15 TaxID=2576916 RepID=UPI001C0B9CAD|nr:glycosyltransferase [Polynucleobacter sp. UK-Mo-2m-Kol15]MBU3574762.1 glycosyltransferase family 4 protein [Polynucleobacter sp. UK-Mo-2m-Kol15]
MISLLASFFTSFVVTFLIIHYQNLHMPLSADEDIKGIQKFHVTSVPRIGGISIVAGIFAATLFNLKSHADTNFATTLLLCAVPAFAIGLMEDLTKNVGVKNRLLLTAISAAMANIYLDAQIIRLDIIGVDYLLALPGVGLIFTIFAITGMANAYNIIDGFNGLSSMVGVITLMGLIYVSYLLGDPLMMYLSLIMAGAILGFFIWNYPRGLIFLGDGGAYLIGFWIAVISVMLVARQPQVSPWFALLINAYPISETLFTIYRRTMHQGKNPLLPDGIHFHTLIFRRILNSISRGHQGAIFTANAKTSPYLWMLTSMAVVPAILWWNSTPILITFTILFTISYIWLYSRIVNFKTPRWAKLL